MSIEDRLQAFEELGKYLRAIDEVEVGELLQKTRNENPWFTPGSVKLALEGIQRYLDGRKLKKWIAHYQVNPHRPKRVGVVMAGNIPLAGFHDFLTVLVAGHSIMAKLSSKDSVLLTHLSEKLITLEPGFKPHIILASQLKNFDAVIATGSDNSSRYFQYYFGKYPHIIRKNRTSCAVLSGNESADDLRLLGRDVFSYFGLGCRNVSKIFIPEGYDVLQLLKAWDIYVDIIHHHKYHNNYDYQKSILLVNKLPFFDSGFVILQENDKLVSPISVVYLERYKNATELNARLPAIADKIQCIVGAGRPDYVPFGHAQQPELWDYADRVDTMEFMEKLGEG